MAITLILDSLSQALLFISAIEFLVSQTPYSMRGLIFGAGYGNVTLFTIIGYGIYWPFIHLSNKQSSILSKEMLATINKLTWSQLGNQDKHYYETVS